MPFFIRTNANRVYSNNNEVGNRFSITSAIDSALKYLRNIRRQPISLQIAIGASSGWYFFLSYKANKFLLDKVKRHLHNRKYLKLSIVA